MKVSCLCTACIAICEYAGFAFAAWLAIMSTVASAGIKAENDKCLSLSGFGRWGLARSDRDNLQFVGELSQLEGLGQHWSARIGLVLSIQANCRFDDDLGDIIQAHGRDRQHGSYRPVIAWAFLRHDPTPIRPLHAGRLGTEFFHVG